MAPKRTIAAVLLYGCFTITAAHAHSGGTGASGGHHNHKTGGYHSHNAGMVAARSVNDGRSRLYFPEAGPKIEVRGPSSVTTVRVMRVKDGDTVVGDSAGREWVLQLAHVDAPELRQPRGEDAKGALEALVLGREATVHLMGVDAYDRILAELVVDGQSANIHLVRNGLAWVPRRYNPPAVLVRAEDKARQEGRGVWGDESATPPWVWRRRPRPAAYFPASKVQCGSKRYCREMQSCAEAQAYLRKCDLQGMDGDQDGLPCESLCRER